MDLYEQPGGPSASCPPVATSWHGKNWFGHPRGLTVLFLTEMWEMFSFFGMRAILVYYMTKHLDMSQEYASLVYGAYAAFVYFTPVFGGMVADRWLGKATCGGDRRRDDGAGPFHDVVRGACSIRRCA